MCMVRWFHRLIHSFVIVIILILAIFLLLREQYDRVIQSLAETQITNTTSDLTNDAIARQIEEGDIRYDRIVYFEKDLDGRITALKTNMSELNRLKTDILHIINDQILM